LVLYRQQLTFILWSLKRRNKFTPHFSKLLTKNLPFYHLPSHKSSKELVPSLTTLELLFGTFLINLELKNLLKELTSETKYFIFNLTMNGSLPMITAFFIGISKTNHKKM
jgi:hypothetical protein